MANLNLSEFTEKLFVADADHTFIWDSAMSISKRVSRNSWLNSGELTSSAPVTISQTWNQIGTAFTAFKVNAVSTASATGSLLLDLQLGGATKFKVDKASVATLGVSAGADNSALYFGGANYSISLTRHATGLDMGVGGDNRISFGLGVGQILLSGRSSLAWSDGNVTNTGTVDTILLRDGAPNTLALRNGAAAQTFNVYGTSSASNANYARLALTCGLDGNATISTQALGTGTAGTVSINGVPVGLGKGNVSTNVVIGTSALALNTTGGLNVVIGLNSLANHTTSSETCAIGASALFNITSGGGNVAYGRSAGRYVTADGVHTTCDTSVFVGANTRAQANSQTNQIVIGYDATGIGSNSVVLGNDSITKTALKGNVGIGTTSPTSKLHVAGELGTNLTTFDSGAAVKITNTTATGKSWLLTSGIINVHNEFFCIRQESVSLTALSIAPTTNNVGIGVNNAASKLTVGNGDIEVLNIASGLILKSPDGTRYRITVPNGGASLTITAV